MRRLLAAVLIALAACASALMVGSAPPRAPYAASVCLVFGPGPVNNGKAVIAAGVAMDVPEDGIVAGLTAAMAETRLLNLANPDVPDSLSAAHDGLAADHQAVGILQQGEAWGTAAERMSPARAAERFFTAMRAIDSWHVRSPAELAGLVQRSAWPGAYADEVPGARRFYRDHIDEVRVTRCPNGATATGARSGNGAPS